MNEAAEILDLVVKRAGANMKQYKMIRHIGSRASVGKKEKWRERLHRLSEIRMMTVEGNTGRGG
jgi:hypothetical protein